MAKPKTVHSVRAVAFDTVSGTQTWTVVGADGLPIDPIEEFLQTLRARGLSPNTVKSYARHLSLYWRWLGSRQLAWDAITFILLTEFIATYRAGIAPLKSRKGGARKRTSVQAVGAAVKEFYDHHQIEGHVSNLMLTRERSTSGGTARKFLAHVERKKGKVIKNRLTEGMATEPPPPPIIQFEADYNRLMDAAVTWRDRLLLSALYEGGLRISQALGLRHEDLHIAEKTITVVRREDNPNGALSKSKHTYDVRMSKSFFDLYSKYLLRELMPAGIDDDMLFVNLQSPWIGRALKYPNAYQQVTSIARRAGLDGVHPHVLRHTHATHLAKKGWTGAEISARIGQTHASSADRYIHLAADDLGNKAKQFHEEIARERADRAT